MEDKNMLNADGLTPAEAKQRRERTLKLITVFFIGAILMLFIGLISAVVVSKMDKFWLNLKLPSAFWYSTIVVMLSSLTLIFAKVFAKQNNQNMIKVMLSATILLGFSFIYFQFQGWKQLIQSGNMVTGGIFFQKGAYGEKFTILKDGEEIVFDGVRYICNGDTLTSEEEDKLVAFVNPICLDHRRYEPHAYEMKNYGSPYSLATKTVTEMNPVPLELKEGTFYREGAELSIDDKATLFTFAFGVKNETPYFGVKGEYGKDFSVSLNGQVLDFIDRKLFFPTVEMSEDEINNVETKHFQEGKEFVIKNGKVYSEGNEVAVNDFYFTDQVSQRSIYINEGKWFLMGEELTAGQYNEFYQSSNIASSFVYVLSAMHALHILFGYGLLIVLLFRTFKGYYHSEHYVGLTVGGYFWHFLGILWLFLFLFWMSISI